MGFEIEKIECDVLIIGGGIGGCRAAMRARELGASVVLNDKAQIGRAGPMTFVHSQFACWDLTDEEKVEWKREFVETTNYLADQDWCDVMLEEVPRRIEDMVGYGVDYERTADGELKYTASRGQRVARTLNVDGRVTMELMRKAAKKQGVQLLEKVAFTDLLTSDGKLPTEGEVIGAVGFHIITGQMFVVSAKSVILNTGPLYPKVHAAHIDGVTGEGHRMAYLAGAELAGMEFTQYAIWSVFNGKFASPGQAKIQGIGADFINADDESFMDRYDPEWGNMSSLFRISRAIIQEEVEGRGPCYVDMRHCEQKDIDTLLKVVPTLAQACENFGWDLKKEPLRSTPLMAVGMGTSGGLRVDTSSRTNVRGLYAVGTCTCLGFTMSGNSGSGHSSYSNVGGYRAGDHAAKRAARSNSFAPINADQLAEIKAALSKPSEKFRALKPADIWKWIGDTTTESQFALYKDEATINKTLERVREIRSLMGNVYAPDAHELLKWVEAKSYVEMVELCCLAYLSRTESRGEHIRTDHPYQDDVDWLKWVIVKRGADKQPEISTWDLPFDRYSVKPPADRKKTPYSFGASVGELG